MKRAINYVLGSVAFAVLFVSGLFFYFSAQGPAYTDFEALRIPENKHAARPYWWSFENRERLELFYIFDSTAAYDLEGVDNKDWNKLTGLSFNWWTNHKNSSMVSWRWSLDCECIELGVYTHKEGGRLIASKDSSQVFARAEVGDTVQTYINVQKPINAVGVTIITPYDTAFFEINYTINIDRKTRVINPWFGGNQKAPHDIFLQRKVI